MARKNSWPSRRAKVPLRLVVVAGVGVLQTRSGLPLVRVRAQATVSLTSPLHNNNNNNNWNHNCDLSGEPIVELTRNTRTGIFTTVSSLSPSFAPTTVSAAAAAVASPTVSPPPVGKRRRQQLRGGNAAAATTTFSFWDRSSFVSCCGYFRRKDPKSTTSMAALPVVLLDSSFYADDTFPRTGDNSSLSSLSTTFTLFPLSVRLTLQEASASSSTTPQQQQQQQQQYILGRLCQCGSGPYLPDILFYCPLEFQYCREPQISSSSSSDSNHSTVLVAPTCHNETREQQIAITLWPILLVWYAILIACLIATQSGRNAVNHVMRYCCTYCCHRSPQFWNRHVVSRWLLWRNPERADRLIRRYLERHRDRMEQRYRELMAEHYEAQRRQESAEGHDDDAERRPTHLKLSTRIFRIRQSSMVGTVKPRTSLTTTTLVASTELETSEELMIANKAEGESKEEEEEATLPEDGDDDDCSESDYNYPSGRQNSYACTICFASVKYGQRVGDLPCQHIFHVDCLKGWLVRRNVCPLCMRPNVAIPSYHITGETSIEAATVVTDGAVAEDAQGDIPSQGVHADGITPTASNESSPIYVDGITPTASNESSPVDVDEVDLHCENANLPHTESDSLSDERSRF